MLTLTGPAGVGKTRLAIEAGSRASGDFAQGAVFADLSLVREPSRVPQALALAVGLRDVESPRLAWRLFAYLRERRSLVILDNFEQVLPAASWLADLLATCPNITLLVTSREPLRLRWEHTYRVAPLALPDPDHLPSLEDLARVPSVALFLERARAVDPGFALDGGNARAVAELCARLDGLPLAIELAAARTGVLSPRMILERLGEGLSLLRWEARDLPERQHTLRGAIGWSHDLLDAGEQALFRRLGVFAGGFTLEAAQNTTPTGGEADGDDVVLDTLDALVDKSLVRAQSRDGEGVRYSLLESVREYALEQLEIREEDESARRAHALYCLGLAERAEPRLVGGGQRAWFLRLEAEHDNLRVAIGWFSSRGEDVLALRLGAALGYFWWMCGHITEGRRELGNLLERAPGGDSEPRTRALRNFGVLLLLHGERGRARAVLEDGLSAARSANDPRGAALSLLCLGVCAMLGGDPEEAVSFLEESLARSRGAGYGWGAAWALSQLGVAAVHARARRLLEEACAEYRLVGDERGMAEALLWRGVALWRQGEVSRAAALVRQVLGTSRGFRDRRLFGLCMDAVLWQVGEVADPEQVARLVGVNEALHQVTGIRPEAFKHVSVAPTAAALGNGLDEKRLSAARTEGRALSLEQVEKLALEVLDGAVEAGLPRGRPAVANRRGLLSERESEVLALVAQGLSNREISGRLFVTESTVRYHLANVFGKLGAGNRTQAVALAQQRSLL